MTEEEARERILSLVGGTALRRLEQMVDLIVAENERQNLISRSTLPLIWRRHVLDSVQLLRFADGAEGQWLDIGTGGGFPGLAIAAVSSRPVVMIEPRRRRADFLSAAVGHLGIVNATVLAATVEKYNGGAVAIMSARAVAPITELLRLSIHCANEETRWILPRGSRFEEDLFVARREWKGMFHVEQSLTDSEARIVVASSVRPR